MSEYDAGAGSRNWFTDFIISTLTRRCIDLTFGQLKVLCEKDKEIIANVQVSFPTDRYWCFFLLFFFIWEHEMSRDCVWRCTRAVPWLHAVVSYLRQIVQHKLSVHGRLRAHGLLQRWYRQATHLSRGICLKVRLEPGQTPRNHEYRQIKRVSSLVLSLINCLVILKVYSMTSAST